MKEKMESGTRHGTYVRKAVNNCVRDRFSTLRSGLPPKTWQCRLGAVRNMHKGWEGKVVLEGGVRIKIQLVGTQGS